MAPKVTLPITIGGFTFRGKHSSEFGVRQTPDSRVLSPLKKRTLLTIPGRSTAIVEEDGSYDVRTESISCSYVAQDGISLQRQVRLIAGWLDGVGELSFDYEPEMRYQAFLSSPPPTVKKLEYATFDLEFTINHPFAYEDARTVKDDLTGTGQSISFPVTGTVETPARIIIKNTGTQIITNLTVVLKTLTD